jgi:hypothetical protein
MQKDVVCVKKWEKEGCYERRIADIDDRELI